MHAGNPYLKEQKDSRRKGSHKKYYTEEGWKTIDEITEMTGISKKEFWGLIKFKSADQIIQMKRKS